MEDLNEGSHTEKYLKESVEKTIETLVTENNLKMEWAKALEENESFQEYLKTFNPVSITDIVANYVQRKFKWYRYGAMYKDLIEQERSKWLDEAYNALTMILQKKLFDLQCLWRANQIKLKGVTISFEFNVLESDPFNCSFLDPITADEVSMYQDFLNNGGLDFNKYIFEYEWQNYDEIKESYHDENRASDMPQWYEFHNLRTGNSRLLLLPDIRGEQEHFYITLADIRNQEIDAVVVTAPAEPIDMRPFLNSYDKNIMDFIVTTFDTKETQIKYSYYTEGDKSDKYDFHYEDIFRLLMNAKECIPIEAHYNFKEALDKAYNAYKCRKISEYLPLAHEHYLFNIEMGLRGLKTRSVHRAGKKLFENLILKGRELNGEPRDFNF
ncbi:hypothetical protein [Flavobacterium sp.]